MGGKEVEVCGDLDLGLVAVSDDALVAVARGGGDYKDAGEAAHLADVGLADIGAAMVHYLDELEDVGEAEIADAEIDAWPAMRAWPGIIVER